MKFKPLKDRVFLVYDEEEGQTKGGLFIPDAAKEKPQKGRVERIGDEVKLVKVGDVVLFDKYAGSKLKMDNKECLIIKEEEIIGIFE